MLTTRPNKDLLILRGEGVGDNTARAEARGPKGEGGVLGDGASSLLVTS